METKAYTNKKAWYSAGMLQTLFAKPWFYHVLAVLQIAWVLYLSWITYTSLAIALTV